MDTVKYILDKLSSNDEKLNLLRKWAVKNRRFSKSVTAYLVLNTIIIYANELEKQKLRNDISELKDAVKELQQTKGE